MTRTVATLCLLALGLAPGCLQIEGGAIELSWVVYCAAGRPPGPGSSCSCRERAARLASVQLVVTGLGDGGPADVCAGQASCRFDAGRQSGNSGFLVPPGDYEISVLPLDANGAALGGPGCLPSGDAGAAEPCWLTPAPLRRTVVKGELVSLGSFLLAVPDEPVIDCCQATDTCP